MTLDLAVSGALPADTTRLRWRDRLCARLGGACALLRAAHAARIPF